MTAGTPGVLYAAVVLAAGVLVFIARRRRRATSARLTLAVCCALAGFAAFAPVFGDPDRTRAAWVVLVVVGFMVVVAPISYDQFLGRNGRVGHRDGDDGARL